MKSAFADDFKTALAVALFTRAWIEILARTDGILRVTVALFTRAWIEIEVARFLKSDYFGRPFHEGVD